MSSEQSRRISAGIARLDIRLEPKLFCCEALTVICHNLGFDYGSILLVDAQGKGKFFTAYNLPDSYQQEAYNIDASLMPTPVGDVIRNNRVEIMQATRFDERLRPWRGLYLRFEIETIVWVPLLDKGKPFGTFNLYSCRDREIHGHETDLLTQLSLLFSMAIVNDEHVQALREKSEYLEKEIIERKRVETELRETGKMAESASRAKSEFLTNMSHEIRTPMNAILGFANILLEEESDPQKAEALQIINDAGHNLLDLINDILDLARIETSKLTVDSVNFSVRKLLEHTERMFVKESLIKKLSFVVRVGRDFPMTVTGDRYKLSKIIRNILKNAFKFTRQGEIVVDAYYDHDTGNAFFRVSDTGIGIPQDKQDIIFDAFRQVDTSTTRKFGGTGLGLTIAAKLTQFLGGDITLDSSDGGGAEFVIIVPLPVCTGKENDAYPA